MSLLDDLKNAQKDAMRAKDKIRLGTIRMALAAVKQHEIDGRLDPNYVEINDDGVLAILIKMVKQRKDAASQYETAGRQDLLDIELAEIVILQDFLPKALSDEELEARKQKQLARGKQAYKPLNRDRYVSSALKAYALLATSADKGAVRDLAKLEELS